MAKVQNIAVLTSGGDSPGMNAAIRAVVRTAVYNNIKVYGIIDGYAGLIADNMKELGYDDVSYILQRGGTIIGTARCNEFLEKSGRRKAYENLKKRKIQDLIVIGGDGSFAGARALSNEFGTNVIGIPGTIDNDIYGTDYTIGFDTAMNTVVEAIDKIRDTASSHHRVFLVEVMGKNSGMIALMAALSSGAEDVFIPGVGEKMNSVVTKIRKAVSAGKSSIIVVAEGDESGGAMKIYESLRKKNFADKLRFTVLGHVQRGGAPSYIDRMNATLYGNHAVICLLKGKTNLMIGHRNGKLIEVPLTHTAKTVTLKSDDYLKLITQLSVY